MFKKLSIITKALNNADSLIVSEKLADNLVREVVNEMFAKGDKIVYPLYGAGIIEDLERKDVDGQERMYYVVRIPIGNLKIMVSTQKADGLGIRKVMDKDTLMTSIGRVRIVPIKMADNWNQRYKDNMEKIKTGRIDEVAEVFRNLRVRERERGLSSVEKKMLSNVKQILLSEIILAHNVERFAAEDLLERAID